MNLPTHDGNHKSLQLSPAVLSTTGSSEELIYCWPHTPESFASKTRENFGVVPVSTVLGAGLVVMLATQNVLSSLLSSHADSASIIGALLASLLVAPLYFLAAKKVWVDRIKIARSGVYFEKSADTDSPHNKYFAWEQIEKIYLIPPKSKNSILSSVLVLEMGKRYGLTWRKKIPLTQIRSASQWRKLVTALRHYCPYPVGLDETLLDGLQQAERRDPSYTKLWYEALTAPPGRARLQPLSAGAQLQQGAYCIDLQIGTGGQGTAYLATTNQISAHAENNATSHSINTTDPAKQVVLKEYILPVYVDVRVRRQSLEIFEHEASMLGSLKHASIVTLLDSFVEDHRAYLVLEYVNGQSVRKLVQSQGPLPESACIDLALDMCDILQYLHTQVPPIVHQDFTPDNLLLSEDGRLKLIDFMVAKHQLPEVCTNTVVGKHHYMPPEQFRGKATSQSDIYAFGATLYFMLTGSDPEPMSVSHPVLCNEEVSSGLNSIVARATEIDTTRRYLSAEALKADLQCLSGHV